MWILAYDLGAGPDAVANSYLVREHALGARSEGLPKGRTTSCNVVAHTTTPGVEGGDTGLLGLRSERCGVGPATQLVQIREGQIRLRERS